MYPGGQLQWGGEQEDQDNVNASIQQDFITFEFDNLCMVAGGANMLI